MAVKEYLIGGLPADLWVGRRTKCTGKDSTRHPFRCKIRSMDGPKITIVPDGHRNTDIVDISDIVPWWSPNSDLKFLLEKQMKQSPAQPKPAGEKQATLNLDLAIREELLKEISVAAAPPVEAAEAPKRYDADIPQPQLLIRSHSHDWLPVYQKYLALVHEENGTLEMRRELDALLHSCHQAQQDVLKELEQLGVEVIMPGKAPVTAGRPKGRPKGSKGSGAERVDAWATRTKERLLKHPSRKVEAFIPAMAREAKIGNRTFRANIGRMGTLYGLVFTGKNATRGARAIGKVRVTLAAL